VQQRARKERGASDRPEDEEIVGSLEFAEQTFKQIEGFGSYGFPEIDAPLFALIAYASSWMKCITPTCSARPAHVVLRAPAVRHRCPQARRRGSSEQPQP
jgi:hypothetical protein